MTGTGPPAVLLHGQPGTGADWQWVTPLLSGRLKVIVPDRPGYGRTGGPATGFAGNAAAVVSLLDRLDIGSAVLAGHSWAGGVVLATAVAYPERVSGLVLVSSVGPGEKIGWHDRLLAAPVVGEAIAATTIGGLGLLLGSRRVQSMAGRRLAGRTSDALSALTRMTRDRSTVWRSFVVEQRALLDDLEDLGHGLAGIEAPAVIVHGEGDRLVRPEVAAKLTGAIPGATLRLLPRAGHLLPHDRAQEVAAAILDVAGAGDVQTDR